MREIISHVLSAVVKLAVAVLIAVAVPANAQDLPSLMNPKAHAVQEQQLLEQQQRIQGRGTLPDVKSYVLEQPAGRKWESFHDVYLRWIAGTAILGIFLMLTGFYLWRGRIRFGKRSGTTMMRFKPFERFVHWMTTVCFLTLAITGLNITFGKKLLLPLIGADAFSDWAQVAKFAHNYVSFPFTIGVMLMFLMWIPSNLPTRADVVWIEHGGGMFGGKEPPSWKFNTGEKLIFWIAVAGGALAALSGYLLLFPFYLLGIASMQLAQMTHSVVGVLYVAAMLVHTYMGTLGTEGAFEGMASGDVDVNWAKVHHSLWYDQEVAGHRRTPSPAE